MVSEAQKRASQRYEQKSYDKILVRFPKGYSEDVLKPAAERAGESVNAYVQGAIADRIARESAAEAQILSEAVTAFAKSVPQKFLITFRIGSETSQETVEAFSRTEAVSKLFDALKSNVEAYSSAGQDDTRLVITYPDGSEEVCEIVSVE